MKKNRKIILCISLICVFILLAAFSYWFFFYPYRVLGVESDSRYYSNHVVSKLTGREESTAILDLSTIMPSSRGEAWGNIISVPIAIPTKKGKFCRSQRNTVKRSFSFLSEKTLAKRLGSWKKAAGNS